MDERVPSNWRSMAQRGRRHALYISVGERRQCGRMAFSINSIDQRTDSDRHQDGEGADERCRLVVGMVLTMVKLCPAV